jgi:hypothetical protein
MTQSIDGARLTLILNKLRLPAIKQDWTAFAERADKESWPAADRVAWILCLYIKGVQRRSAWRGAKKPSVLPYSVPYQNGWNFWRTFNTLILRSFHWNWPGYPCNAVTTAPSHPGIGKHQDLWGVHAAVAWMASAESPVSEAGLPPPQRS